MSSSVTVQQAPRAAALGVAVPQKSRGKSLMLVGAVALLLVLAVVGVGGFFAVNWLKAKPGGTATVSSKNGQADSGSTSSADPTAATTEYGRYWLEVLPHSFGAAPMRVAGAVPLASGQAFKFHFQFEDDGYLYIIGPGEGNKPTAFLTENPPDISGLADNRVSKGGDFSFPSGLEHWLELDKKPGTENYTIIFSPQTFSEPAFFSSKATGKPLGETEQAELNDFLAKHKKTEPVTELNDKDAAAPFVKIKVPESFGSSDMEPLIFDVRIQHK
jgi:hypothetical protein